MAAGYFDYYSGLVRDVGGRTIPNLRHDLFAFTLREPAGVAAILTPWNYPLLIAAQKMAPALCAGCTVILKPAPWTPLSSLELARGFEEIGFPNGVLNVLTDSGPGSPVGEALVAHPDVSVVSFTGSSATGKRVLQAAAATMKRVALECGGKSPNIIHRDADLDQALDGAVAGIFFNSGQVCNGGSRLLIHEDIADEFMPRLLDITRSLRIGDPSDPSTQVGPVISDVHLDHVLSYIEIGKAEGAKLLVGGRRIKNPEFKHGCFLEPTIFDDVQQSMRIAREEIFGPVLAVTRYRNIDDAIEMGNSTPYGLAGAIWSKDIEVITKVTEQLDVGMVWVNEYLAMFPETPHGGYGLSGIGREMGPEALLEFQENKTVIQKTGPRVMRVQ
jgi:acyl-CoA reductase-like NAD-dependent aldehyde dehydrogenase